MREFSPITASAYNSALIVSGSRNVFPDTNAQFLGEKPQHVYSVRMTARELWGEQASPRDSVYLDMWDDYLEPA